MNNFVLPVMPSTARCPLTRPSARGGRAVSGRPRFRRLLLSAALLMSVALAVVSSTPAQGNAQEYLAIRDQQAGPPFTYNPERQYVRVRLTNVAVPRTTQGRPSWRTFLSAILRGRQTEHSISTIDIAIEGDSTYQSVLFSMEKQGDNFTTSALAGPGSIGYHLTDEFVFDNSFPVRVTVSRSDWEERQDVLSSFATSLGGIPGVETAVLPQVAFQLFDAVSLLFPPAQTGMALTATIVPSDLTATDLIVGSGLPDHTVDMFTLQFDTVPGHFHDYDLPAGLRRARLTSVLESWRAMVEEADEQTPISGIDPVLSTITSFARFVSRLPLTRYDRAILTACAVRDWAPNVFYGTQVDGENVQFTHNHYSRLPTGNLNAIRGSDCAIDTPVSCNTDVCRFMVGFLNKSALPFGRREVAQTALDEYLSLSLSGQVLELTPDDYVRVIRIPHPARFEIQSSIPGSWTFAFEDGTLPLSVDGTSYAGSTVYVDVVRAEMGDGQRFIVTGIRVEGLG